MKENHIEPTTNEQTDFTCIDLGFISIVSDESTFDVRRNSVAHITNGNEDATLKKTQTKNTKAEDENISEGDSKSDHKNVLEHSLLADNNPTSKLVIVKWQSRCWHLIINSIVFVWHTDWCCLNLLLEVCWTPGNCEQNGSLLFIS